MKWFTHIGVALVIVALSALSVMQMGCAADQRTARIETARQGIIALTSLKVDQAQCAAGVDPANQSAVAHCTSAASAIDGQIAGNCDIVKLDKNAPSPTVCAKVSGPPIPPKQE